VSERPTIFEIFADVKREVAAVGRDSRNIQQGFMYRSADAVVNAAAPALDKYGVITVPHLDKQTYDIVEIGNNRTRMSHALVEVTYTFYGPRGDSFPAKVAGEAMDNGDKATAKAMTVAYRIALSQALNLPTHEPDPDSDSYERSPAAPKDRPEEPRQPWLAPDDPWRAKVAAVQSIEDANKAFADLEASVSAGEISRHRADAAKALLDGRVAEIRHRAAKREQTAAGREQGPAAKQAGDGDWALQFRAMLLAATAPEVLDGKRRDIGRAMAGKLITPDVATKLAAELAARKSDLEHETAGTPA
jgi:hypothetical protein